MSKFPTTYSLFDSVYGSDIPIEQLFLINFNALPSKYSDNKNYDAKIIEYFKSVGFEEEMNIHSTNRRSEIGYNSLFINHKESLMFRLTGFIQNKKDNLFTIEFYFDVKKGNFETQYDQNKLSSFERTKKRANINLVKSDHGNLDTEEYDLLVQPIDLEMNYGEDFVKIHNLIVKRLNKNNDKGIILLHGDPGTGKTSYIKYLTSLIVEKDILFIPPSMAEMLSEPAIIPFLMDHKNSILIIEDAERVISDRENNGSSAGVSNILNLTDGILGDCLGIQIIATFNMRREKIDQALLRPGRLIAEHKFEKLSINETNKLLKNLNKNHIATEGMSLADIYNIDVEIFKSTKKSKIGLIN